MIANNHSFHAKLYKFTYSSDLPENLCPYFWKLVIGFLLLIPNALLQLPTRIFKGLLEDLYSTDFKDTGNYQSYGLLTWFLLALAAVVIISLIHLGLWIFGFNHIPFLAGLGMTVLFTVAAFVSVHFYNEWKEDREFKKELRRLEGIEEKQGIVMEFLKATYNRYCPKIKWR